MCVWFLKTSSKPSTPLQIKWVFIYINNQEQKKGQEAENRMETENVFEALASETMA